MSGAAKARRVHLPSGRIVLVRIDRDVATPKKTERGLFAEVLALIASGRMRVEDLKPAEPIDLERLPLPDFHVLRDFAIRSKLVPSERETFPCDNCDAELAFDGAALPLDDLADRYEDEERTTESRVTLPALGLLRMERVTVARARPLWRELGKERPFRITPKLLDAMGVVALEGETDLRAIAKKLDAAPDEAWSRVEETFLALAYPPRAIASITCAACETVHDMEVPWPRELEPGAYRQERDEAATFPDADAFTTRARALAEETWRAMDAGGLVLRVELGVPEVDSGGVPMLGSYTPEARDDGGTDFVVRVYYRTFERAFRDDASFDWEHELAETIEHEAQHHLYYLSGHDPMDAQERAESERELVRRVGGAKRYRKLQERALLSSVWEIVRVLAPALALVALAVLVLSRCS